MKARLIALAVLIALILAFALPVIFDSDPPVSRRFTATVETPNGIKSGSSVVTFTRSRAPWWFPSEGRSTTGMRGEGIVVDLGSGRYLFVLMRPVRNVRTIFNTGGHQGNFSSFLRPQRLDERGNIKGQLWPMLISFTDINNPKTGFEVDPGNLSASFGSGYRLRSIRVEETSEVASFGAMDRFAALRNGLDEISRLAFSEGKPR